MAIQIDLSKGKVTAAEKETWNNKANPSDIPTKTSQLINDSKFVSRNYQKYTISSLQSYIDIDFDDTFNYRIVFNIYVNGGSTGYLSFKQLNSDKNNRYNQYWGTSLNVIGGNTIGSKYNTGDDNTAFRLTNENNSGTFVGQIDINKVYSGDSRSFIKYNGVKGNWDSCDSFSNIAVSPYMYQSSTKYLRFFISTSGTLNGIIQVYSEKEGV